MSKEAEEIMTHPKLRYDLTTAAGLLGIANQELVALLVELIPDFQKRSPHTLTQEEMDRIASHMKSGELSK
jgi:hypothetical protein